jgi:REP element-mobilizing transposase RayT
MRTLRADWPASVHHVFNRARHREHVFATTLAKNDFIRRIAELKIRFGVAVQAYCLMDNHFHLILESSGRLSAAMQWLQGGFGAYVNVIQGTEGPVFKGRFSNRLVVDEAYHAHLFCYLDRNPVEASLVSDPADWPWSSHRALAGLDPSPGWLSQTGRDLHGGPVGYRAYIADDAEPACFDAETLWGRTNCVLVPAVRPGPTPDQVVIATAAFLQVDAGGRRTTAVLRVLVDDLGVTCGEAGELFSMSSNAVRKRLDRSRGVRDLEAQYQRVQRLLASPG